MSEFEIPKQFSRWQHRNGNTYLVLVITNLLDTTDYPMTVVYQNDENGTMWSRPVRDWHRSFTATP